jgi:hypothetical protein
VRLDATEFSRRSGSAIGRTLVVLLVELVPIAFNRRSWMWELQPENPRLREDAPLPSTELIRGSKSSPEGQI